LLAFAVSLVLGLFTPSALAEESAEQQIKDLLGNCAALANAGSAEEFLTSCIRPSKLEEMRGSGAYSRLAEVLQGEVGKKMAATLTKALDLTPALDDGGTTAVTKNAEGKVVAKFASEEGKWFLNLS